LKKKGVEMIRKKMGKQPVNASLRAYHNIEAPATGADWQLQFQLQLLFPK